ncbi:MAG TPA: phosphatase PAP2 family protein [Mycobacteriales bacterium]|nr:phosphatase PAP2 family protein [Mycobacteriales bacterium]
MPDRPLAAVGRPGVSRRPALAFLRRHRFALAIGGLIALLAVIVQQVLDYGYLVDLDYHVHELRLDLRYPQLYDPMFYLVMIGQRGPAAMVTGTIAVMLAWRFRTWRPILVLGGTLLALNLAVGGGKLYTARLKPAEGTADIFAGGIIFPSGHAANVVITWGIAVYLLGAYGVVRRRWIGTSIAAGASLIVGVGSIYLDTHWLSDILAGWAVGAIILMVAIRLDRRVTMSRIRELLRPSDDELARRGHDDVAAGQDGDRVRSGGGGR